MGNRVDHRRHCLLDTGTLAIWLCLVCLRCGKAGMMKEKELDHEKKQETIKKFDLKKDCWWALFAES